MANENKEKRLRLNGANRRRVNHYAIISLISFLCAGGLFGLMIWNAERLVALALISNFYYIVLLPLAAAVAAFLFGVLNSRAQYQGRQLGGVLKLGGPIVGAALVMIGGYVFVQTRETFPLTVYAHGTGGAHATPLKNSGYVLLDLGPDRRREEIGDKGQAYFPAIPGSFRGREVAIWVESDVVEIVDPGKKRRLDGSTLYIPVQKKAGRITGRVEDGNGRPVHGAEIEVVGVSTSSNASGYFELLVPGDRMKPELELQALAPGYGPSRYTVVPNANELTITLTPAP